MTQSNPSALKYVSECLYRHHAGTYYAIVKAAGKQIKRSLKTDDPSLARRRLAQFRKKAERLIGSQTSLTFEVLAQRWLDSIKTHLKHHSHRRRATNVNCLLPYFKGHLARNIGIQEIEQWKAGRGVNLSARSYNIEIETLRLIFEYAREDLRIILENPAERLKRRKVIQKAAFIPTKQQFTELIKAFKLEPKAAESAHFIEFLAYSGMRLDEAIHLKWTDINQNGDFLTITGGQFGTKNNQNRTIPLFPPLKNLLERIPKPPENDGNNFIFRLKSARKALFSACKRAKLPQMGHHTMRHFFCSNAIEAGIDFKVIADWLGHKDGGILVAKTYGHLRQEHSKAMAQKLTFSAENI